MQQDDPTLKKKLNELEQNTGILEQILKRFVPLILNKIYIINGQRCIFFLSYDFTNQRPIGFHLFHMNIFINT